MSEEYDPAVVAFLQHGETGSTHMQEMDTKMSAVTEVLRQIAAQIELRGGSFNNLPVSEQSNLFRPFAHSLNNLNDAIAGHLEPFSAEFSSCVRSYREIKNSSNVSDQSRAVELQIREGIKGWVHAAETMANGTANFRQGVSEKLPLFERLGYGDLARQTLRSLDQVVSHSKQVKRDLADALR